MSNTYAEGVRRSFDAVARVNAWTSAMASYRNGFEKGYRTGVEGEAQRLKALYVDGSLTIEAFEAKLDFAFGLRRQTNETSATP